MLLTIGAQLRSDGSLSLIVERKYRSINLIMEAEVDNFKGPDNEVRTLLL